MSVSCVGLQNACGTECNIGGNKEEGCSTQETIIERLHHQGFTLTVSSLLWLTVYAVSLSLTELVVLQAAALALKKVPEVNSTWTDEYIRQ